MTHRMKNAIIIPGRPDREEYYDPARTTNSNDHWYPWLSKQLMQQDIFTVALEIPKPYQPSREYTDKGHFTLGSLHGEAFPELRDYVLA
jgi:hypothetical protein